MSLWLCEEHGLVGPEACCPQASRASLSEISASVPPEPPTLSEERYPLITDAECRAFERHAEEGATADPLGEGVEYSLIQPYDLVRFCRTVTELRARIEESDND